MTQVFRREEKKLVSETVFHHFLPSHREMATVCAPVYPNVGGRKKLVSSTLLCFPAGPCKLDRQKADE